MDQDKETRRPPYANYQEKQLADLHLWMTTQEAAEHSGYDIKHVRRLARQGKIGAVKKGRDWWIDVALTARPEGEAYRQRFSTKQ